MTTGRGASFITRRMRGGHFTPFHCTSRSPSQKYRRWRRDDALRRYARQVITGAMPRLITSGAAHTGYTKLLRWGMAGRRESVAACSASRRYIS